MDNLRIYSKNTLETMNLDKKYGYSPWITNLNNINSKDDVVMYPTGDYTLSSGRIYIALPANKKLTQLEKEKYNIIN
jgi:hypothetical protein